MFDIKRFGAYLSKLRKNADMTQSELSDILNVTRQAISKYENGDSFPDISILKSLADTFNITFDNLIKAGRPDSTEAALLVKAAINNDSSSTSSNSTTIDNIIEFAPYLKRSVLERTTTGFARHGIDISSILDLVDYLDNNSVESYLLDTSYSMDKELLARILPFLKNESIYAVFNKVLDGELDCDALEIILPYGDYYFSTYVEEAVMDGAIDVKALKIVRDYNYREYQKRLQYMYSDD